MDTPGSNPGSDNEILVVVPSLAATAPPPPCQPHTTLFTSQAAVNKKLVERCSTDDQLAVVGVQGRDVECWRGQVTEKQMRSGWPSYINAVLIQSRSDLADPDFTDCERGKGMFVECCQFASW
ncbi:hypothetical protein EJ04DRAFT_529787 [Polyplosphaeria fusca]|uniref:Uncharacterized protein n=1 Tax=Polyplosphaeria fusca TaxID=682080 RepID=A0A9P4QLA8_9PLEO|nr:hypothetical protein EJ04DRAFT_529787 [Polyplosphaeria fusca]